MAKTEKICIVCGTKFEGTAKAKVCTDKTACRTKLSRMLKKGEKPPFDLTTKLEIKHLVLPEIYDAPKIVVKDEPQNYQKEFPDGKKHIGFSNAMLEIRRKKLGLQ